MVVGATAVLIGSWVTYIALRSANRLAGYAFLFSLFIFGFVITQGAFSLFYIMMALVAIALTEISPLLKGENNAMRITLGSNTYTGLVYVGVAIAIGLAMYGIIAIVSSQVGGTIVGAPNLALSSTSEIAQATKPTLVSMLGIIENMYAYFIFEVLVLVGVGFRLLLLIGELLPLALAGLVMGWFHVAAYSVSVSLIIWAAFAFVMFVGSKFFFKDSLPGDLAHGINNALVDLRRGLQIV